MCRRMPNAIAASLAPATARPRPAYSTAELMIGLASMWSPQIVTPRYVNMPSSTCTSRNPTTATSPNRLSGVSHARYKRRISAPALAAACAVAQRRGLRPGSEPPADMGRIRAAITPVEDLAHGHLEDCRRGHREQRAEDAEQRPADQQRDDHGHRADADLALHHLRYEQVVFDLLLRDEEHDHEQRGLRRHRQRHQNRRDRRENRPDDRDHLTNRRDQREHVEIR